MKWCICFCIGCMSFFVCGNITQSIVLLDQALTLIDESLFSPELEMVCFLRADLPGMDPKNALNTAGSYGYKNYYYDNSEIDTAMGVFVANGKKKIKNLDLTKTVMYKGGKTTVLKELFKQKELFSFLSLFGLEEKTGEKYININKNISPFEYGVKTGGSPCVPAFAKIDIMRVLLNGGLADQGDFNKFMKKNYWGLQGFDDYKKVNTDCYLQGNVTDKNLDRYLRFGLVPTGPELIKEIEVFLRGKIEKILSPIVFYDYKTVVFWKEKGLIPALEAYFKASKKNFAEVDQDYLPTFLWLAALMKDENKFNILFNKAMNKTKKITKYDWPYFILLLRLCEQRAFTAGKDALKKKFPAIEKALVFYNDSDEDKFKNIGADGQFAFLVYVILLGNEELYQPAWKQYKTLFKEDSSENEDLEFLAQLAFENSANKDMYRFVVKPYFDTLDKEEKKEKFIDNTLKRAKKEHAEVDKVYKKLHPKKQEKSLLDELNENLKKIQAGTFLKKVNKKDSDKKKVAPKGLADTMKDILANRRKYIDGDDDSDDDGDDE